MLLNKAKEKSFVITLYKTAITYSMVVSNFDVFDFEELLKEIYIGYIQSYLS